MNFTTGSKKRLLFLVPSLIGGGAERVVVHLVNSLDKARYDVLLVVFENKQDYQKDLEPSVKLVSLFKKNRWDFFKLIFRLRALIRNYEPTTVISFLYYTNIIAVMASTFLKRTFKLVICERSYPYSCLSKIRLGPLKKCLTKFAYGKADRIVVVSNAIKRVFEEDFKIQPEKLITIYNPIRLDAIRDRTHEEVDHPFFKGENRKVIISVGRLIEVKRFDRLLRVFSLVRKKEENAYLIILGRGKLLGDLHSLVAQLGIDGWVEFVGFKPNPYVWVSKADIFALSSDSEGFPNVIIEAMACGTPVISTDCISGPREIITNGKNAILVPPADEEVFAETILTLLKDGDSRRRFSKEGRKRAEDFSIDKILPQYERLF